MILRWDLTEDLQKLYNEKKANKPAQILPVKIPKKIKKKDIEILSIDERELKYYEYDVIGTDPGTKIYNGILIADKSKILNNIEFYKKISPHDKFTELCPSTLTSRGELSNMDFNEEIFIKTLAIPLIEYAAILKIGCNFGEIYNYPNPFNPSTTINFAIPEATLVTLKVFNALGEEVALLVDGFMESGIHEINFEAVELNSGIYFYRIQAGDFAQVKKMTLLK